MRTFLVAVVLFVALVGAEPPRKQLAGPPDEFQSMRVPNPQEAALQENTAYIHFELTENVPGKAFSTELELPADNNKLFGFGYFSPLSDSLQLTFTDPNGQQVNLQQYAYPGVMPLLQDNTNDVPGITYLFESPIVGVYHLTITSKDSAYETVKNFTRSSPYPEGAIILWNDSPIQATAYLSSYNLEVGNEVGLVASITDQEWELGSPLPTALLGVVAAADMDVFLPDGAEVNVQMHDDGLHADGAANDGVYGGLIPAPAAGQYLASAVLRGSTPDGTQFLRSTQHIINVIDDEMSLTGTAVGVSDGSNRLKLNLGVSTSNTNKYRAYAEVYGVDAHGNQVAVCWVGGMVNSAVYQSENVVTLELDLSWLVLAGANAPLTLKNVYLTDLASWLPVTQMSEIPVTMQASIDYMMKKLTLAGVPEITEEMLMGKRPQNFTVGAGDGDIILLHGYCAGGNPWQSSPSQWTRPYFFSNPNANIGHDEYAMLVTAWVDKNGVDAFSGVGHSQGGMVLLHLLNFYWTGLSSTTTGLYKIQSIGTPYQGCSGAGSAANMGKIFGVGCGANDDLTTDGAKLWLSGIQPANKAQVAYYTTTYELGRLFGDSCNLAVNMILEWPNDGTAELEFAQLPGAINKGNKQKWCHTTSMSYPAQYTDATRNMQMNTDAAR